LVVEYPRGKRDEQVLSYLANLVNPNRKEGGG